MWPISASCSTAPSGTRSLRLLTMRSRLSRFSRSKYPFRFGDAGVQRGVQVALDDDAGGSRMATAASAELFSHVVQQHRKVQLHATPDPAGYPFLFIVRAYERDVRPEPHQRSGRLGPERAHLRGHEQVIALPYKRQPGRRLEHRDAG